MDEAPGSAPPTMDRLRWQCRRSLLELDLLFEQFLENGYESLPDTDKEQFVRLLEYPDQTLQEWLMGKTPPEDREIAQIVALVRASI